MNDSDLLLKACHKAGVQIGDVRQFYVTHRDDESVTVRLVFTAIPLRPNLTVSFPPEELRGSP